MKEEEFYLIVPTLVKGLVIGSIMLIIGIAAVFLVQSSDLFMGVAMVAIPGGLLWFLGCALLILLLYNDISPFRSIRKIVVSGSGIMLYKRDNSVASVVAWREVVNVEYQMMTRRILGTEVEREPDSLCLTLTDGRTFKIPLAEILAKEDRPAMVRAVVTHLGVVFQPSAQG